MRRALDPDFVVYRMRGALFFGAAASIGAVLDRIADAHRALILDFTAVPFLDSTAANTIEGLARKTSRRGARMYLTGTSEDVRRELFAHGLRPPLVRYKPRIEDAVRPRKRCRAVARLGVDETRSAQCGAERLQDLQ